MMDTARIQTEQMRGAKVMSRIVEYLSAYRDDLQYQFGTDGYEYMNSASCGTPEFENDKEAKKYLEDLNKFIANVEKDQ